MKQPHRILNNHKFGHNPDSISFSWNCCVGCCIQTGDAYSPQVPGLIAEYLCVQGFATILIEMCMVLHSPFGF